MTCHRCGAQFESNGIDVTCGPCWRSAERAELVAEHVELADHAVGWAKGRWPYADRDELLSAALEGLVDAARLWQPEDGVTFAGYARHRIRGAIVDDWRRRHGRHGERIHRPFPLHDDGEIDEAWFAVDEHGYDAITDAVHAAATIATVGLSDRERRVLVELGEGRTLREVANGLGVTEARVSQIRKAVHDRLPEFARAPHRCAVCTTTIVRGKGGREYCGPDCYRVARRERRRARAA